MALIALSGKMGSGKDTVGKIIQYLVSEKARENTGYNISFEDFSNKAWNEEVLSGWQIKKFADKLKDIVCILTGCTREQLENIEFKNSKLPDEWIRYGYAKGFYTYSDGTKIMNNVQCDKERYELEHRTNWQTAYKVHPTYREILQYIGTDLFRDKFHNNTWVNAFFVDYKKIFNPFSKTDSSGDYPNWIITDMRFTNELQAVKDRNGISIRVNRISTLNNKASHCASYEKEIATHMSETELDNSEFDYVIDNNGDINDLINSVKTVLKDIKEKHPSFVF